MISVFLHSALGRVAALAVVVVCLGSACDAPQPTGEESTKQPTTTQSVADVNQHDIETVIANYFSAYNNADVDGMSKVSFGYVLAGIQDKGEAYQTNIVENLAKNGKITILGYGEFSSQKDIRASIVVSTRRDNVPVNVEFRFNMVKLKNDWRVNQIEQL